MPDEKNNILFLFIYYPPDHKQEEVDQILHLASMIYMYKTDFKYEKIILLASTEGFREYKFGLIYQEFPMDQMMKDHLDNLCNQFGWFKNMSKTEITYKEFPNE